LVCAEHLEHTTSRLGASAELALVAVPIGAPGFTTFAKDLERLGVLDGEELLGLLRLHGSVLRAVEEPLDNGDHFDQETFSEPGRLLADGER
jgi:hypothetical protein